MSKKFSLLIVTLMVASLIFAACAPQEVITTVEVTKEVEVIKTVEVEKEVEVVKTVEVEKEWRSSRPSR